MDRLTILAFSWALLCPATASGQATHADSSAAPDYLGPVRQELARLGVEARCEPAAGTCSFERRLSGSDETVTVVVRYSARTCTVQAYIDRFVPLPDPAGPTLALARRLLELNREMISSRLEWDRATSSVRLSTVLATDSNFDRKAFRSQMLALWAAADRIRPQLLALAAARE